MNERLGRPIALLWAVALAAALAVAAPARADVPDPDGGVALILTAAPAGLEPEPLRAAIARELGVPVTLPAAASAARGELLLRLEGARRARLRYRAVDGRAVERVIDLPEDPRRAVEVLALLAGNLVRDEAAELAAALRPPAPAPVSAPAPAPALAPRPISLSLPSSAADAPDALPQHRFHLDLWGTEAGLLMITARHGGAHLHALYGAGVLARAEGARVALTLGLGVHAPLSARVFTDVDLVASSLHATDGQVPQATLFSVRALLGLRLGAGIAIHGGPTANMALSLDPAATELSLLGSYPLHEGVTGYALRTAWPGFCVGVQAL